MSFSSCFKTGIGKFLNSAPAIYNKLRDVNGNFSLLRFSHGNHLSNDHTEPSRNACQHFRTSGCSSILHSGADKMLRQKLLVVQTLDFLFFPQRIRKTSINFIGKVKLGFFHYFQPYSM